MCRTLLLQPGDHGFPFLAKWLAESTVRFASMVIGGRWFVSNRLAHRTESRAHFCTKQLGLFPRSEVAALVELVEVDELGIRPLGPAPRGCVDLVGKDAHC